MAQPKQFDINQIENLLTNFANKAQTLSCWNTAVEHGKTVKEIDEILASNDDNKQLAELLLRRADAIYRRERLNKTVAIKAKCQPQIPEMFSAVNKAMQSQFVQLQQQNSSLGGVKILMSVLKGENQILNHSNLEDEKRVVEEKMMNNEKLCDDKIANREEVDDEDYAALCQELLRKKSEDKTKTGALLKSGDERAIAKS